MTLRTWPIALLTLGLLLLPTPTLGAPMAAEDRRVGHVAVRVLRIDLTDPRTVLDLTLADPQAGRRAPSGDAPFRAFLPTPPAAAVVNGTYFSMDARRSVMGTMVKAGKLVNHVAFKPRGTTFGLLPGNRPDMVPADRADWRRHWLSLTAGPRLLTDGAVTLRPREEGFFDPGVYGAATRTALGFTRDGRTLLLVSMHTPVDLPTEARVMAALGAHQAMSLDGGTCRALAERGRVTVRPGRPLTNAIAVYDATTPAPPALEAAMHAFTASRETPAPLRVAHRTYDCGPFACGRVGPVKTLTDRPFDFEGWGFTRFRDRPAVRNRDGWLELVGPGVTAIRPPTGLPGGRYTLSWLGRLTGPSFQLHLGGATLRLDRTPSTLTWVQGGRVKASAMVSPGDDRHHFALTVGPEGVGLAIDGRQTLTAPGLARPAAIGISGAGALQGLTLTRW